MTGRPRRKPIAYTDTQLTYCPNCAAELDLLSGTTAPTNWLPFGPIDDVDDLPQKQCDRCEAFLADLPPRRRSVVRGK